MTGACTGAAVCGHTRSGRQGGTACRLYAGHRGEHLYRRSSAGAPLKVCPSCGRAQSLEDAFQHRADGSAFSWCKSCNRAYAKDRRARKAVEQ